MSVIIQAYIWTHNPHVSLSSTIPQVDDALQMCDGLSTWFNNVNVKMFNKREYKKH